MRLWLRVAVGGRFGCSRLRVLLGWLMRSRRMRAGLGELFATALSRFAPNGILAALGCEYICECLHARTSDVGYGRCRFSHEEKASAAEDGDDEEEDL